MMLLENKINLLTEKINIADFLITEMKRIGIEKLPYPQSSLKRFIDSKTMDVHYNGHYKTYVKKLNDALSKKNYGDLELEEIIKSISRFPKTIRNNGGGAFNHALFWKMLSPKKQEIPTQLKSKIIKEFGSIKEFENQFGEVAKERFGSGWCWLILTKNNRLKIMSTPNQDNPLMNVVEGGGFPLLGLDLWEHAYYLKYQNKRDEYIKNFWNVVNWEFVNKLYTEKTKTKITESIKTKQLIKEEVEVLKSNGRLNPAFVQTMLKKVYPKCSPEIIRNYNPSTRIESPCYGKIKSEMCDTNYGVIGGKYAMSQRGGTGEWSALNWFDANTFVSDMILDLYKRFNREKIDLKSWLRKMSNSLLSEDGYFTPQLADLIINPETKSGTLNRGIEREKIAIDILNTEYKDSKINQFCDGDIRDKYNGQDMFININGVDEYIQVKPTIDLHESKDENGNIIYIFKSKNNYNPDNIQIFGFIDNRNNYIFFDFENVEIEDEGGSSKERFSYIFKPEFIRFKSPTIRIKKNGLTESKKIVITKKQLQRITEVVSNGFDRENLLDDLCSKFGENSIYCKFKNEVVDKLDENLKSTTIKSLNTIIKFFYNTNEKDIDYIVLEKIFELALIADLSANFIKVIEDFIVDTSFDDTTTKRNLKRLKRRKNPISDAELDEILRKSRELAYSKYELSLTGKYMKLKRTSPRMKYKSDEIKQNFKNLVDSAQQGQIDVNNLIDELYKNLSKYMSSPKVNPIKADLESTTTFYEIIENVNEKRILKPVFPTGSFFEVKMMDTNADSYVSEFFSIFKEGKLDTLKDTHLPTYNKIINGIFNKIVSDENKAGEVYLGKMKKNLAGVVFDKNVIVPIQYIEMYWSNQGQKKCNSEIIKAEARLSIRFRIKEGDIVSYIYDPNSRILQRNPNQIVGGSFEKVYC